MLHTAAFVVVSLFTLSKACNYVKDPTWIEEYDDGNGNSWDNHRNRNGPIPLGFCTTNANSSDTYNKDYSEIFLCTSWGQLYHFGFQGYKDCDGEPTISEVVSNSGYECFSTESCSVFNVRSNRDSGDCLQNTDVYDDFAVVTDTCWVERNDNYDNEGNWISASWMSIMAVCDDTDSVSYNVYPDVIDCTGEPNADYSVVASSGTCETTPGDGGMEYRYIDVLHCGLTTPQEQSTFSDAISAATCSYVSNAAFTTEHECDWDSVNNVPIICTDDRVYDVITPMAGNMDAADVCTKQYHNSSDGEYYTSQLVFCADVIQMAFIATWWSEDGVPRCRGPPTDLTTITGSDAFACNNVAGPCPNMLMRISEFEDDSSDGICGYGDEWNEIRIATGKCWATNDGYAKAVCGEDTASGDGAQYEAYADDTCSGASLPLAITDGECYDFKDQFGPQRDEPGNYSNVRILECHGDKVASEEIPDCKYVESPVWTIEFTDDGGNTVEYTHDNDENFRIPIGQCMTRMRPEGAESRIFICTPWEQVVVFEFYGDSCTDLTKLSFEPSLVEGFNNNCASENYCNAIDGAFMSVMSNPTTGCYENATNYDQNVFIPGCTTNGLESTYVMCNDEDNTVEYSVYDQPGCQGNELLDVDIDTDTGNCDGFGDEDRFVELLACGNQYPDEPTSCSYIINPAWNSSVYGYDVRDGAIPLSTDLCYTRVDSESDEVLSSSMYWCNKDINQSFISWWNGTAGCTGYPDEVELMWTTVEGGFECTGDNAEYCDFGFVTTSNLDADADCTLGGDIEQSARLTDQCWPSTDGSSSWLVDCGVNEDSEEYEFEIQLFYGDDCTGTRLNKIYIDDNTCVSDFIPGLDEDSQTYFDIAYCTKTEPLERLTFCEENDIDEPSWYGEPLQAKCNFCVCEADYDGNGFAEICEIGAYIISECTGIYCEIQRKVLTELVGCDSFEQIRAKTDEDGFQCSPAGFYCDDGSTGDANMFKVGIITLFSVFMFVIY